MAAGQQSRVSFKRAGNVQGLDNATALWALLALELLAMFHLRGQFRRHHGG